MAKVKKTPAKATPKPPTTNAEMIAQAKAAIAKLEGSIKTGTQSAIELGALNPSVIKKAEGETNTEFLKRKQATEALARTNAMADNPLLNKAVKPTDAPPGQYYTWIGGTNTGQWQLYNIPGGGSLGGASGAGGSSTTTTTSTSKVEISDTTKDAFAAMQDLFASYGLESLAGEISGYMTQGLTPGEALIKLKTNPSGAYAKRFAGNFARVKNGLNAISEATYLGLESSYAETLKAYGLGNMVSPNREDNYKKFADYIAADISAVEFKDRIDTVVTRVQNADPSIKATLKQFYPELNDSDLIGYFLNPKDNLPKLQEKVTASEIGAAAKYYNMGTDVRAATDLAKYGVDQKAAREGYSTIAGVLPTATKLGDIYNETGVRYAQAEGEAEVFKGNQDAATKRKRLASMERAAFSGSSGVGQSSLGRSTQGLI
jgi:hypothetical protein